MERGDSCKDHVITREGGDYGMFIAQVPQVLKKFAYLLAQQFWRLFFEFYWLIH